MLIFQKSINNSWYLTYYHENVGCDGVRESDLKPWVVRIFFHFRKMNPEKFNKNEMDETRTTAEFIELIYFTVKIYVTNL